MMEEADHKSRSHAERARGETLRYGSRVGYLLVAWVFVLFVMAQVFLAGLSIFVGPAGWPRHVEFGHYFGPLSLALLVLALVGRLLRRTVLLTLLLMLLYSLQYVFIEVPPQIGLPELSALHPVNALLIFWLALSLALQSRTFLAGAKGDVADSHREGGHVISRDRPSGR
jgi:hypothetical protein